VWLEGFSKLKQFDDLIGSRIRDFPSRSRVPHYIKSVDQNAIAEISSAEWNGLK
jgi:hypothetical protein